jgi:1-hydroxycarotenoid 3,4-desaturase
MRNLGESLGARYRFGCHAAEIVVVDGRAAGVVLDSGERLDADAVVFNGDVSALSTGLLGGAARHAAAGTPRRARSLSAVTWCQHSRTSGFPLQHHNVFFAEDYPAEFSSIFARRTIVDAPTVYVCAQDRGEAAGELSPGQPERLLVLVNAPADGDSTPSGADWLETCARNSFGLLEACGLTIARDSARTVATTPADFERLFPASGGALYGPASIGAMSTFRRSGSTTPIPGLFLAGGSVHPGPGIPMAAMSGRLAAAALLESRSTGARH